MRFLRNLLWVALVAFAAVVAARNWRDVTLNLWGDLQADIKIPLLMLIMFLVGFVPAWLVYRARHWRYVRQSAVAPRPVERAEEPREGSPE